MANMKKFDALFVFLDEYRKMDHDEKIFCQKVLMSFNNSIPVGITKEDVMEEPEPFIPKEEQLPKESVSIKSAAPGSWIQSQCDMCGNSFVKNNNKQKFCCHDCAVKSSVKKRSKTKVCLACWKVFKSPKINAKYCSRECKYTATKWKRIQNKNETPIVVNKKDDPFFKPKFIFWD